jgi:hypothetical protein
MSVCNDHVLYLVDSLDQITGQGIAELKSSKQRAHAMVMVKLTPNLTAIFRKII